MTEDSIFSLIENLPSSVKCHIVDFQDVKLKTGHKALRVILDKLLTEYTARELISAKETILADLHFLAVINEKTTPAERAIYSYLETELESAKFPEEN